MKLTADKNEFADAFLKAASFAPSSSPNERLKSILLTATKESLTFTATDTEVGIRVELTGKANVTKPGRCLLRREQIGEILKASSAEELSIIETARGIDLAIGWSEYKLMTANVSDYPDVDVPTLREYHTLAANDLCHAIGRTVYATDESSARFALGGIKFELSDACDVIGTDGRRLAQTKIKGTPSKAGYVAESIVPTKACKLFAKALAEQGDVKFAVTTNDVSIIADGMTLLARQVQGRFPQWRQIFPSNKNARIELTAGTLQSAIRSASIVLSDDTRGLDFAFSAGQLKLCAKTESGESIVAVPIGYDGTDIGATLDNRYVLEFLKQIDSESNAAIDLIDGEHGVVLSSGDDYRYVVMPLARSA